MSSARIRLGRLWQPTVFITLCNLQIWGVWSHPPLSLCSALHSLPPSLQRTSSPCNHRATNVHWQEAQGPTTTPNSPLLLNPTSGHCTKSVIRIWKVFFFRTGCPKRATRWRSDPSPVSGLHGIFHCKDLLLSHGGSHLHEKRMQVDKRDIPLQ